MRGGVLAVLADRPRRPADAGGGDAGAQRAELDGRVDGAHDGLGLCDVAVDVGAAEFVRDLLAALTVEVGDDHLRAARRELAGGRLADAGGTTGDDR